MKEKDKRVELRLTTKEKEQLEKTSLQHIKSVVKRYVIGCGIVVGIWLLFFLIELGDKL